MPVYSDVDFDITYSSERTTGPVDLEYDGRYAIAVPRGSRPRSFTILDNSDGRYKVEGRACCFKYTLGMKFVEYGGKLHVLNISLNKAGSKVIIKLYSMAGQLEKEIVKKVNFLKNKRHVLFSQDDSRSFAYLFFDNTFYVFDVENFSLKKSKAVGYSMNKNPGYFKADPISDRFVFSNPNNQQTSVCRISNPSGCVALNHINKNTIRNVTFYKNHILLGQGKNGLASFNAETGELVLNYDFGYLQKTDAIHAIEKYDVLLLGTRTGVTVYRLSSGEKLDFIDIEKTSAGNYPDLKLIRYISVNGDLFAVWGNGSVVKIDYVDEN